jgi:hypothetical protein
VEFNLLFMGDIEMDKCDFCNEVKHVNRTYLHPSKYIKPEGDERLKLYNEGNYFIIVKTCNDCGAPTKKRVKEFDVWTEGYRATGEGSKAVFHGTFKGRSFREAVQAFKDTLKDEHSIRCVDVEELKFWGCRFFDNESDARKSFG